MVDANLKVTSLTLDDLKEHKFSFVGWLMSMTQKEAGNLVASAGGQVVHSPSANTSVLVVGNGDRKLRANGQVRSATIRAQHYKNRFTNLNLLSETEFLRIFGLAKKIEDLERLFTAAQLSRVLNVPTREIRTWVKQRLIQPAKMMRRLHWFDFREITVAQTIKVLTDSGLTAAHVGNGIQQLSSWLPDYKATVTQFEVLADSSELGVRLKNGLLTDSRGQLLFDFDYDSVAPKICDFFPTRAECIPDVLQEMGVIFDLEEEQHSLKVNPAVLEHSVRSTDKGARQSLDELFRLAVLAEDAGNWERARFFYEQALEQNGSDPEILFNCGNVLYEQGYKYDAAKSYLRAVTIDPHYLSPFNNLGNALAEIGRLNDAVRVYRYVLSLKPDYVEARSNLAETLVCLGWYKEARFHWMCCLTIDPTCSWADAIHVLLRSLPTDDA